jgi:hypothetical protein
MSPGCATGSDAVRNDHFAPQHPIDWFDGDKGDEEDKSFNYIYLSLVSTF